MDKLSEKKPNVEALEFTFANFRDAGALIRIIVIDIMREKNLSPKDVSRDAGLKYMSFLGYMNEKFNSMSFKNMNILRKYILSIYND